MTGGSQQLRRRTTPREQDQDAEARAVTIGAGAFDRGDPREACPYPDPIRARYWRLGWNVRRRATTRWARQLDQMKETIERAAPFIDRDTKPGHVLPSKLIALHFYAVGSTEPDRAWAWFCATMKEYRRRYRDTAP